MMEPQQQQQQAQGSQQQQQNEDGGSGKGGFLSRQSSTRWTPTKITSPVGERIRYLPKPVGP